jgi:F-type H+-transporting ATPase subunit epsilon
MGKSLQFEMISPEAPVLATPAEFVVLPALNGEMGVLPDHEPFLVQLREGEVRVTAGGSVKNYAVSGGFAEVRQNKVSLFVETAEMVSAIDAERARQDLEKARAETLKPGLDPLMLAQAEAAMRRAQSRLRISQLRRGPRRGEPRPE